MKTPAYSRRKFLKTMGMSAAALTVLKSFPSVAKSAAAPNILLYVVDDLGSGDAGCYGNPVIKTPGLDFLAREGTRFTHAFCTTASCSPSRSTLLSGQYSHATGQYGLSHRFHHFASFSHIQTLPVLLRQAGYRTVRVGKYHVAPESVYGFDMQIENVPLPSNDAPLASSDLPSTSSDLPLSPLSNVPLSPKQLAQQCKFLFTDADSSPFFLYFCTTEPHRPFRREGSDAIAPEDVIVPPYLPDIPECRTELANYYMSVQRSDKGLLCLIELLQETGRWDDTIIVFVSDNGIAFPGAKTTVYEPGIRLPCVIRTPEQDEGNKVCHAMVSWADLTPTLLDLAGVLPDEPSFQGRSFKAVMNQENPEGWDEIYASHTFHEVTMYYPMRALRGRRYKLIWNIAHKLNYPFASDLWNSETWQAFMRQNLTHFGQRKIDAYIHRSPFELYDLKSDPDEVHNLADDPAYATLLNDYKQKIRQFQERTGDPWIVKWEYE